MRITISTPQGQPFVLADDAAPRVLTPGAFINGIGGTIREGFRPAQARMVQQTNLPRAPYAFQAPRYNLRNTLAFTVQRTFNTVATCLLFLSNHCDLIPTQGELQLTQPGSQSLWLPNALLQTVACVEHTGVRCVIQYQFTAPGPWQQNP